MIAGIMAAGMSTIDLLVIVLGRHLEGIYQNLMNRNASDAEIPWGSPACVTCVFGVVAILFESGVPVPSSTSSSPLAADDLGDTRPPGALLEADDKVRGPSWAS